MADVEDEAYGSDVTEEYSEDNDKVSYGSEMKPSDSDIPSTETLKQFSETDIGSLDNYLFANTAQGLEALANNEMAQGGLQTTSPIIPDSEMNGSAGARAILKEASPSQYFRPVTPVGHENTMFPSPTGTPGRAVQSPGRGRARVTIFPPSPRASPSGRTAHVTVYPSPDRGSPLSSSSPGRTNSPFTSPPPRTDSSFLSPPARISPFSSPNRSPRQPSQPSPGRGAAIRGTGAKAGRARGQTARGGRGQTARGGRGRAIGSPTPTTGFSSQLAEMLKGSKTFDPYKSPEPVVKSSRTGQVHAQQSPTSEPRGRGSRARGQATRGGGRGGRGSTRGQPKQVTAKGASGRQLGPSQTMQAVPQKPACSSALAYMLQGSSNLLGALQQSPHQVQTPQHKMPEMKSQVSEQLQAALKGSQAMQASSGGQPVAVVQPRGRSPKEKSETNPVMENTKSDTDGVGSGVIKTEKPEKPSNGYNQELTDSEPKAKLPPIDVFLKSNKEVTDFKLPAGVAEKAETDDAVDDEEETAGSGNAEVEETKSEPASKTSTGKNSNKHPARKGTKRKKDEDLDDYDDDEEYYGCDEEDDDDYLPEEKDQMVDKDQVPKAKKPPARKRTKRVKDTDADYLPQGRAATRGNGKVVAAEVHKEQGLFSDEDTVSTESRKPDQRGKNTKAKPGPKSRNAKAQSKAKKNTEVQMDDVSEENIQDDVEQSNTGTAEQSVNRKRSPKRREISEAQNDDEQVEDQSRLDGDAAESGESETSKSPAGKKKTTTSKKTPAKAKKNAPIPNKKTDKDARKKLESALKDCEVLIPVFKCYSCDETFASNGELAKHDAEYHPQMFECNKCRAVFIDEEAFLKHDAECDVNPVEEEREVDKSEKPSNFACQECEEEFEDRIELERHIMTHGYEAGFACTACLQKFATEEEKEQHMNVDHPDEASFACTSCLQRFATEEEKEHHMKQYHNADE